MTPVQHQLFPTLHADDLSERERELVALVLRERLSSLVVSVVAADEASWRVMVREWHAEDLPGEGLVESRLGMIRVLMVCLGLRPWSLEEFVVVRGVRV